MKTLSRIGFALSLALASPNFSFGSDTSAADRLRSQSTLAQQIQLGAWRAFADAGLITPGTEDYTIQNSHLVPPQDALGMTQSDIEIGGTILERLKRRDEEALGQKKTLVLMIDTFEQRCLEDKKDVNLLTEIANSLITQITELQAFMSGCWTLTHLYTDIVDHTDEECFQLLQENMSPLEEEIKNQETYPQFPIPYSEEEIKIISTHDCQSFGKNPQDEEINENVTEETQPKEDGEPIEDCNTEQNPEDVIPPETTLPTEQEETHETDLNGDESLEPAPEENTPTEPEFNEEDPEATNTPEDGDLNP